MFHGYTMSLLKRIQTAETNITTNSEDIYRMNGFVGFDGQ